MLIPPVPSQGEKGAEDLMEIVYFEGSDAK
jgi:hypothetical protein